MQRHFNLRTLAAAGALVAAVIATTASGSESSSSVDGASTKNTVSSGIGSADASADVVSISCGAPDELGFTYPSVTVKNNSSKASNYMITVVAESADGATRYDDTLIIINSLNPNQTMTEDGLPFTNDLPAGFVCKVTEVQRTAA